MPDVQYRTAWYGLAPPWLRTGYAEKYLYTLQLCSDLLIDKMNQAGKIGIPGIGDPSQIPYLANDRVLLQGPSESNANFIARLRNAFAAWKKAGSRVSILSQLQAYLQNLQPGVAAVLPEMVIVGGNSTSTTWSQVFLNTPLGGQPALTTVPVNFNWDGHYLPWRSWLVLFMAQVPTGLSGSSGATSTAFGTNAGTGANVNGVWTPNVTSPINTPFVTLTGLSGLTSAQLGQWITISGSSNAGNNGVFQIGGVASSTSCVIANPNNVTGDAGPLTWSIGSYPFIAPGNIWDFPGSKFGSGELTAPPLDTGSLVGGIWQPTTAATPSSSPTISWGLSCSAQTIQSIRTILQRWKSAGAYYPDIVIAFDGGTGAAGSSYSPISSEGSGNPDGTFGGRGKTVAGVWQPNRQTGSPYNAYCQGTGSWPGGSAMIT